MKKISNGIYIIETIDDEKILLEKMKTEYYYIININYNEFILYINNNEYYGHYYYWESKENSLIWCEYILNQIQYTLEHTAVKTLIEYKLDKVYEKYKPILENEIVRWKYTF